MVDGNTIAAIARANLGKMYNSINSAGGTGYYTSTTGEAWCADFAKWVWDQAGVNVSGLTPGAVSFAGYGELGDTPQVGDAVVFGVNSSKTYAQHVAIVVDVQGGNVTSIGGDEGTGSPPQNHVQQDTYAWAVGPSSYWGFPISGYVQPKGLAPPTPTAHPPAVAVSSDGDVSVFWRGLEGYLWQGTGAGSGDLKGTRLGFGPMATGPTAGVDAQGHLYVYWEGTDGNLHEAYWDGATWQQASRGFGELGSAPAVAVSGDGDVSVFWAGLGHYLWQGSGPGSGDLKGTRLGFGPMATAPAAGVDAQGHMNVYWEGTDGNLWETYWNGSAWQAQANRGFGELGSAPAVAVSGDGEVNAFWAGLGHYLWQGQGSGSGDLKGTRLGFGPMATAPTAGVDAHGHLYVYWVGTDGNLWEAYWDGSTWQQANRGYGQVG